MNEDRTFNILTYVLFAVFIAIILASSWKSYLNYLNRKLLIEAIKDKDPKYINEQMQGLMNDIKK